MKQIFKYLSKEDINDIEKTIESEELKTSSEICVVIKYKIPAVYKNLQKYALHLFKQYKIFKTKNRNGILILFILKTKQFYILFDEGIYKKIDSSYLDNLVLKISEEIKNKSIKDGIICSIKEVNNIILQYFPIEPDDTNELDNLKL
ncbi:TPM domain-containing protein [Patescibacteria group bacterium]|nr:TPM domain-containing protein [Patescibacteria group bacterium]